jgi:hypothetical protein
MYIRRLLLQDKVHERKAQVLKKRWQEQVDFPIQVRSTSQRHHACPITALSSAW